jgi:hypothetical protein
LRQLAPHRQIIRESPDEANRAEPLILRRLDHPPGDRTLDQERARPHIRPAQRPGFPRAETCIRQRRDQDGVSNAFRSEQLHPDSLDARRRKSANKSLASWLRLPDIPHRVRIDQTAQNREPTGARKNGERLCHRRLPDLSLFEGLSERIDTAGGE